MAVLALRIEIEREPYMDAVGDLMGVHAALSGRHGEAFRVLDRRVESLLEALPLPDLHHLDAIERGALIMIATPPRVLSEALAEARRLGVTPRR